MFKTIVVGTDGSETAAKAVQEAASIAARLSASLELVSATEEGAADSGQAVLDRVRGEVEAAGVSSVNLHAKTGDPAEAIIEVAEQTSADLIVVGNKGMTGAKRFLLGSVPNQVSHHAPCSVLIIRTT